jgi:uncharacterized protein YndB with AHSA1/START domain
VHRSITVDWDQAEAFRRFTDRFGSWWPIRTHSVGGEETLTAVFEGRVGGQIYEVRKDGSRSQWGTVLAWEPPSRVIFTWHPGREPATAGEVELRFVQEGSRTRLELTHGKWDNFGKRARLARRGYRLGGRYVLDIWAGRRSATVRVLDAINWLLELKRFFRR